jgi:hypothetical protein
MIPAPDRDNASGSAEDVEDETVVLPTAYKLRLPSLAAGDGADTTRMPAPAPVVDTPTDTIPAPEIDILDRV